MVALTLDTVVAAAPADVRETLDDETLAYLRTVVPQAAEADEMRRALTPFLGMSAKDLDAMFTRLSLGDGNEEKEKVKEKKERRRDDKDRDRPTKPPVQAYSQQSRFHSATLTTLSKDVDLRNVNIVIGDTDLLVDSRLWLKAGTHYGLVGRNGAGKSTLLGVIGDKSLVGWPENIRTLYVQQLDVVDTDESVIETVLGADIERHKRVGDVRRLEAAVAEQHGVEDAIEVYVKRIAEERIDAAQKIATLRSGKRGKTARGVALKAEQTMVAAVRAEVYGDAAADAAGIAAAAAGVLAKLYAELDAMDAHSAEARARAILTSLDVSDEMADGPVRRLSGGWRMRVALAKAMFVQPDVLLLDECTNHLDLAAIAWLQEYLTSLVDITIVCVSHDRDFLNAISQEIIRLKDRTLSYHPGNYDDYEQTEDELRKKKERQHASLERRREHVKKSIEKFKAHAKSANDDKVLGQVASRAKKLERMSGMEKTEDGKRFKVSYWAGYHDTMRPEIELIKTEKEVDLRLPKPDAIVSPGPILSLNSVSFSYAKKKHRVLKSISLSIMYGDHIAIVGLNGCGKSTLVQLIAGALQPTHGHIERHGRLKIGHYTQHFVDELSSVRESALAMLIDHAREVNTGPDGIPAEPKEGDMRKWLGSFELGGSLATRPVHTLSGGQRARLAMALMLFSRPHLLLLDEITNHLDMYAVQGLVTAVNDFEGAVVLITHDRHFVRETADEVYALEGGRLELLESVDDYAARFGEA